MVQYLHFSILKLPLIRGTWESMGYNLYNCRISRFYGIVEVFDRFCWITTIGVSVGSITLVFGVSITGWWLSHLPLRKMMELKSVGMMTFPTEWKNKKCSKPPTSNWWWYTHWYWWASYGDFMGFFMGFFLDSMGFNGIEKDLMGFSHAVKPFINPNDSPQMGGTRPPKLEVYGMCRTQHDQNVSFRKVDSSSKKCGCWPTNNY